MPNQGSDNPTQHSFSRTFIAGSAIYLAAWTIHTTDHIRRGIFEPAIGVQVLGNFQVLLTLGFVWLLWKGHSITPVAAIGIGVPVALGVSIAHLAPDFGFVSDSLWAAEVDMFTWFAVALEIAGSIVLAMAGWLEWRSVDYAVPVTPFMRRPTRN